MSRNPEHACKPNLNREFSNVVRGFGFEPAPDGLSLRFFPRMSADPIGPRFDYDESATIAFNLCQQVAVTSGGYRGGDLTLPRAGLNGTDRIRCPGVSGWAENVVLINRVQLTMQIMREGEAVSIPDTVADLVTSPSWYGAAPADPPVAPPQFVPVTRTCASGAGVGAYWEEQILATQIQGPTP